MKKMDVHIVGLGNLGSAFLNGLKGLDANIYLYEESNEVRQSIKKNYSISPEESLTAIGGGVLLLCIKPQNINEFFNTHKNKIEKDVLICTPVAGLEIKTIEKNLDNNILRIMPNLLIRNKTGFIPYASNYQGDYPVSYTHLTLPTIYSV